LWPACGDFISPTFNPSIHPSIRAAPATGRKNIDGKILVELLWKLQNVIERKNVTSANFLFIIEK
jgi:hypothetical protein